MLWAVGRKSNLTRIRNFAVFGVYVNVMYTHIVLALKTTGKLKTLFIFMEINTQGKFSKHPKCEYVTRTKHNGEKKRSHVVVLLCSYIYSYHKYSIVILKTNSIRPNVTHTNSFYVGTWSSFSWFVFLQNNSKYRYYLIHTVNLHSNYMFYLMYLYRVSPT